ncbi:MAG: DNA methyltransferase, partial [Dehalococcoidales bacterium]|nr:DNA methyltransferase [Dehalococcoidales bacterium]
MEEAQEFCQARVTDCYDCAEAASCPALNELFLKYYKKNGVNNYQATTRAVPHPKNSLNELGGAEWLYFTKTLLTTSYSRRYGHELRKAHGANKPPELMKHLIEFFTRGGDRVLDPFAGVGGTLLGAAIAAPPRQCTGIEINPKWIDIYHRVVEDSNSRGEDLRRYEMIQGDCLEVLRSFDAGSFQFIATDPPYNRHLEKTMCTGQYRDFANRQTDYDMRSDDPLDLANLSTYAEYLDAMERVLGECYRVLEPKKYLALIIRDAYQDGEYIFTHVDIAR